MLNTLKNQIVIASMSQAYDDKALQISSKLGVALSSQRTVKGIHDTAFVLYITQKQLWLYVTAQNHTPITIDFSSHDYHPITTRDLLAKALGIKRNYRPHIIDCNAGLARDAYAIAQLACPVTLIERHPLIHLLLEDGLKRLENPQIQQSMELIEANSIEWLHQYNNPTKPLEVIYLDPMFPHSSKSRLVKKEMQWLQQLCGADADSPELLDIALQKATKRVVVKRPRKAPALEGPTPSHTIDGKTIRYDVYMVNRDIAEC